MDDPIRHQRVRQLFEVLRALPRAEQDAALSRACADDAGLRAQVARLLDAAAQQGSFLEHGAAAALSSGARKIGERIGPYEITGILGAGGMGEVYRARDTLLGRDVALKFARFELIASAERLARLRREAQVLAALNHRNIAAIHGIDESQGTLALVLELVEGATLADRLARGALSLDESLAIAGQLIDALEAAHACGIVHRDLKPSNVKLRVDGTVKVLDFGLATAPELDEAASPASQPLSHSGMIVGTARYMSPEQARGRPVDKRTDVWAFGCVLFEMLTGAAAFDAAENADTLVAILTRTPRWQLLPRSTPESIRRLLRRCLEKDRARRLADISDARLELDDALGTATPGEAGAAPARRWIPWSMAVAALVALALLIARRYETPPLPNVIKASVVLPGTLGETRSAAAPAFALSPDGHHLAFIASGSDGHTQLWTRALDDVEARPIAGTQDAQSVFWSSDSRWLAFVQDRRLRKVAATGGTIYTLADDAIAGGAWNADDVILFTQSTGVLARVSADGGSAAALTGITPNKGEVFNLQPFFLPDGNGYGYVSLGLGSVHADVFIASLDGSLPARKLPIQASLVRYAGGHLWFMRGRTLMAQPFDARNRELSGAALPIAEQVRIDNSQFRSGMFSVSNTGAFVYQRDPAPGFELTWFDRQGTRRGTLGTAADYADVDISPDGRRALVSVAPDSTAARDLWIFDLARGLRTRFTFDDMRPIRTPVWSSDGSQVVFATQRNDRIVLMRKAVNGASDAEIVFDDPFDKEPLSWSADGRNLLYARRASISKPETWVLPLGGAGKPHAFSQSRARFSAFSPDGRWVAFDSAQSGRVEIYVAPFPGPGRATQVSNNGGFNARWRGDGRELFYLQAQDNKLMSVEMSFADGSIVPGDPKPLFDLAWIGPRMTYDVMPDGGKVLALTQPPSAGSIPLTLVLNWPALIRK